MNKVLLYVLVAIVSAAVIVGVVFLILHLTKKTSAEVPAKPGEELYTITWVYDGATNKMIAQTRAESKMAGNTPFEINSDGTAVLLPKNSYQITGTEGSNTEDVTISLELEFTTKKDDKDIKNIVPLGVTVDGNTSWNKKTQAITSSVAIDSYFRPFFTDDMKDEVTLGKNSFFILHFNNLVI